MIKLKWFLYTVCVGMTPIFVKMFIFLSLSEKSLKGLFNLFDPADFITLGLVISITNINELEGRVNIEKEWKTLCIGWSVISIIAYAVLFGLSVNCSIDAKYSKSTVLCSSIIFSIGSIIFGRSVCKKLDEYERRTP